MSQANAAARKRRAGGASLQEVPPAPAQTQSRVQQPPANGLTLPQVISLVDKRLTTLEIFMKESKAEISDAQQADTQAATEDAVNALADEINAKFVMLAGEVENLKDIVLKLQAYTMEVNKTLYEERIHVLSDMGPGPKSDNLVLELSEDE